MDREGGMRFSAETTRALADFLSKYAEKDSRTFLIDFQDMENHHRMAIYVLDAQGSFVSLSVFHPLG